MNVLISSQGSKSIFACRDFYSAMSFRRAILFLSLLSLYRNSENNFRRVHNLMSDAPTTIFQRHLWYRHF